MDNSSSDQRLLNVLDEYQHLKCEEIQTIYLREMNCDIVMCLNLTGEFNIGTIIRTASLFCMGKVIIVGKRSYDKRTTVGMHRYIPTERIIAYKGDDDIELDVEKIKNILEVLCQTHQIIFVEHGGFGLRNIHEHVDHNRPILFVLGPEGEGIPLELLKMPNTQITSIKQHGIGRSFNVGHAFAMVVYEYYRYK
jgi:tRNA G18 (ribose-2'-O)-methylase SpoU